MHTNMLGSLTVQLMFMSVMTIYQISLGKKV